MMSQKLIFLLFLKYVNDTEASSLFNGQEAEVITIKNKTLNTKH